MMNTNNLIGNLKIFIKKNLRFNNAHQRLKDDHVYSHFEKFLHSSMDEVRIKEAGICTKAILEISDIDDADFFRLGLLRREITGEISYQKQRDHFAHTLHNYLLGWYFYINCSAIEQEMLKHFKKRDPKRRNQHKADDFFLMVWPFVSILHDIGYLFEGAMTPLDISTNNQRIKIGVEIVNEYFHHGLWNACHIDSVYEKELIKQGAKVKEIRISDFSVTGIADALRSLGNLKDLRSAVSKELTEDRKLRKKKGKNEDAFDLWEENYKFFDSDGMSKRIKRMRTYWETLLVDGREYSGLRMLDHGICSGLLQLLFSTYYNRLRFGMETNQQSLNPEQQKAFEKFKGRENDKQTPYKADWWWKGIIWATAATALHNFQQERDSENKKWKKLFESYTPLQLNEDPLAYLGILVDCLQEWDRYNVNPESVVGDSQPLQGVDVGLEKTDNTITITYDTTKRANKVKENLKKALSGWEEIVNVVSLEDSCS